MRELGRPTIGRTPKVKVTITDSREPLRVEEHMQLVRLLSHIAAHNRGAAKGTYKVSAGDDPALWDALEDKIKQATRVTIERTREI